MKQYFIFTFLILSSVMTAQKSIIGDWKIVSINNGEIYYNFPKDSIAVLPEFGETDLSASTILQIKQTTKMVYGHTKFYFDKNGNYKWILMPAVECNGKFIADEKKQIIRMDGQNSLGEKVTEEFPYLLKDNYLQITIPSEPQGKYVLEKL